MTALKKAKQAEAVTTIDPQSDDEKKQVESRRIADLLTSSSFNAACIQRAIATGTTGREISLVDVHAKLMEKADAVVNGDMSGAERMLMTQASTLDLLFHDLIQKARNADVMPKLEAYMRMALKAQQQSVAALRVLGELKSPKQIAFIKQANVAHQQQINNGVEGSSARARAHEGSGNQSNGLLEEQHGEWLDSRAAGQAGRGNQAVEAVGTFNRARDRGG